MTDDGVEYRNVLKSKPLPCHRICYTNNKLFSSIVVEEVLSVRLSDPFALVDVFLPGLKRSYVKDMLEHDEDAFFRSEACSMKNVHIIHAIDDYT